MLSEKDLANGNVQASDDLEGVTELIQSMYNAVMKNHSKIKLLVEAKQLKEAADLRITLKELQDEISDMMKSHMNYLKFLEYIDKDKAPKKKAGVLKSIKDEKSSLGAIVQTVPKS